MESRATFDYKSGVEAIVRRVLTNLDDDHDPVVLADLAGFSRYHFHRIFKGLMGESMSDLVRRLRLERAAYELATTERPITQIAFDAGYGTHESFIRGFRAAFEKTPSDFRKAHQGVWMLPADNRVHYTSAAVEVQLTMQYYGEKPMDIETKTMPAMRLLAMRHIGPYNMIGSTFESLWKYIFSKGIRPAPSVGVWHDSPVSVAPEDLRSDACLIVDPSFTLPDAVAPQKEGDLHVFDIPEDTYAVGTHIGSYCGLGPAWEEFWASVVSKGYEVKDGACFEIYYDDPSRVPEEKLRTDLFVSVKA